MLYHSKPLGQNHRYKLEDKTMASSVAARMGSRKSFLLLLSQEPEKSWVRYRVVYDKM